MSGSNDYDPRQRLKALLSTAQRNQPKIVSSNVKGLVTPEGAPIAPPPQPIEGLCVLVSAIMNDPSVLPTDFRSVSMTRDGLKAHVRPDGGVCLGFFGNGPEDACVVYGDPSIDPDAAKRFAQSFVSEHRKRFAVSLVVT